MSKKQKITELILDSDLSFEEIVVQSGAKASYVKSVFTQLNLNWEERDAEGIELKTIIVKEEDIEEIAEEDIPEDAEILENPSIVEVVVAENGEEDESVDEQAVEEASEQMEEESSEESSDESDDEGEENQIDEEFIKEVEKAYKGACRNYRNIAARMLKTILDDLKSEKPGQYQDRLNRMRKMHVRTILQKRLFSDVIEIADKYAKLIK